MRISREVGHAVSTTGMIFPIEYILLMSSGGVGLRCVGIRTHVTFPVTLLLC